MRFPIAVGFAVVLGVYPAWGQQTMPPPGRQSAEDDPPAVPYFYVPYGGAYGHGGGPNYGHTRRGADIDFRTGRQIERHRQNAYEARRRIDTYRYSNQLPRYQPSPPPGTEHGTGYAPYGYGGQQSNPWDRYWQYGRDLEYYRQEELRAREEMTRLFHQDFLSRGIREFRQGRYGQAARSFMAAADKDQGDAGSRLHAGQALVAVGMYEHALAYFRRAFELQPKLMNMPLNLQADYGNKPDYTQHVIKLEAYCRMNEKDGRAWLLLAVEHFFGPKPNRAAQAFQKAKVLLGKDYLLELLVRSAEPMLRGASAKSNERT